MSTNYIVIVEWMNRNLNVFPFPIGHIIRHYRFFTPSELIALHYYDRPIRNSEEKHKDENQLKI